MQKKDWVQRIEQTLATHQPFVARVIEENKGPLVFAADVFRRRRYSMRSPYLYKHLKQEKRFCMSAYFHIHPP
jgi:hypothetical protein